MNDAYTAEKLQQAFAVANSAFHRFQERMEELRQEEKEAARRAEEEDRCETEPLDPAVLSWGLHGRSVWVSRLVDLRRVWLSRSYGRALRPP